MPFLAHITLADLSLIASLALVAFALGAVFAVRSLRQTRR